MEQIHPKPTVQDRGYAWVIVAASFFLQAVQSGVRFSYGLFFIEFLKEFNKGKGQTAWVGSIAQSAFNLQGPVSAYIINRFGYRASTIVGSFITSTGFLLSYFVPNLYYLYFTFGLLQGIGFGMVFMSAFVATGQYFKQKRALAIGISFSGGGTGTFAFLPLFRLIIDTYGWRYSLLILAAGVALNGCVFGSLLRPFIEDELKLKDVENETVKESNKGHDENTKSAKSHEIINESNKQGTYSLHEKQEFPLEPIKSDQDYTETVNESVDISSANLSSCYNVEIISEGKNSSTQTMKNEDPKEVSQNTSQQNDEKKEKFKNDFIEKILPKELVTNSSFVILMLSTVFIALPEFVPFSMLPDFALNINCSSEQSAWTLSAIGIGALVSQTSVGWIADMKCVHNLSLLGCVIISIGVTTMTVAVIPTLETLITYSALYGLLSGALYTVQPIVILEYIDESYMATMQGLTMWVYGISGLLGSPAAGWLYDATGSYKSSFLAAGACFALSGCINFLVICTKRNRKNKVTSRN